MLHKAIGTMITCIRYGYLRHYYRAARHPQPLRMIALFIALFILLLVICTFLTYTALQKTELQLADYASLVFWYCLPVVTLPSVVLWVQGYRHRDRIAADVDPPELPNDMPLGKLFWQIILLMVVLKVLVGWYKG